MKRENRVDEVLSSLEGVQKAKAPHDGFLKIQQKLAQQRQGVQSSVVPQSNHSWMKVAAVIALVVCSNVWVITNYLSSDSQTMTASDAYSQVTIDFNLYENE